MAAVLSLFGSWGVPIAVPFGAVTGLLFTGVLLTPRAAAAQPSSAYKQHMKNGVKLYRDANYDAAVVEFEAAYLAEPKANPLVNIALCRKGQFNYPKAIGALELALSKHAGSMAADDKKAAEEAIVEMRGLLAFVNVTVTPPQATLMVDGHEQPAEAASKPLALGPGTHRIGARLKGYAGAEETVTVASGEKGKTVTLTLVPNQGFLTVRGDTPKTRILINQKPVGLGVWTGLLDPGTYLVQIDKLGAPPYNVQVQILAGEAQEIRRGFGGLRLGGEAPMPMPIAPPPAPKQPEPATPPQRGFFAVATGSLLIPLALPQGLGAAALESGAAVGLRGGYRVNTPASFDLMFEYGNVSDTVSVEDLPADVSYSLTSLRFGLNLRLMSPGQKVRLVGNVGGGLVHSGLAMETELAEDQCEECNGLDGFLLGEIGVELDFGGVLLGLAFRNYFQSTKGIGAQGYDNDPLVFVGGGLSIGYGTW